MFTCSNDNCTFPAQARTSHESSPTYHIILKHLPSFAYILLLGEFSTKIDKNPK